MRTLILTLVAIIIVANATETVFGYVTSNKESQNDSLVVRVKSYYDDEPISTNLMLLTIANMPIPGDLSTNWQEWKIIQDAWKTVIPLTGTMTGFIYDHPTFGEVKYVVLHTASGNIEIHQDVGSGRWGWTDLVTYDSHYFTPYVWYVNRIRQSKN